ncbi:dihydrofolate reductase family protein [Puniceicoccaceae bacterium K14]|nr:dihydrofolate reductase family protein [Puniceicoccaceae bacterium K14]
MRNISLLIFMSADGVMQAPGHPDEDRSGEFEQGGWASPNWEEVMQQVMSEAMEQPYDLLLGYNTYKMFASHRPDATGPVANRLNHSTKYVVTSTQDKLQWQNSIKVSGDIVEEIKRLKSQEGRLLQVHGSWQLVQTLISNRLVDELRLWTFPLILGEGKRLFSNSLNYSSLELIKLSSTSNGAIMSIYKVN